MREEPKDPGEMYDNMKAHFRTQGSVDIKTKCFYCGSIKILTVNAERYELWKAGMLIQKAFPSLSSDDRERLMTGICTECWDSMFSEEEL